MEPVIEIAPKSWECDMMAALDPKTKRLRTVPKLCVFGAGLVGQAVARIAPLAGFRVLVVDDREAVANRAHFPHVDEIKVCPFEQAVDEIEMDRKTFVVIMTHRHRWDYHILEKMLHKHAGYIGMIGSRDKVAKIFYALKKNGFTECELSRVCAPIGLDIGGHAPGEIAVGIVAQMIQVRYRQVRLADVSTEKMGSVPWDVLLRG
jgi:xanthine dehydrogenase accessory factor